MNTVMKYMPGMGCIETDMNIRDRHEHRDEIYAGRELYRDRHEH